MYTRSAIFEGHIHPGREDEFFALVDAELLPIWRRMPNALAVRVMRTRDTDPEAPPLAMVQEIDYPSLDAVKEALASPVRAEGRAVTDRLMTLFEGRFYHVVYEQVAPR